MNSKNVKRLVGVMVVSFVGLGLTGLLSGCQGRQASHAMASDTGYQTLGCQMCYDEIIKVKRTLPPSKPVGPAYRVYREHQCPDCNTSMKIYSEDGQLMIQCAGCAPEGKSCDKCLPPA